MCALSIGGKGSLGFFLKDAWKNKIILPASQDFKGNNEYYTAEGVEAKSLFLPPAVNKAEGLLFLFFSALRGQLIFRIGSS